MDSGVPLKVPVLQVLTLLCPASATFPESYNGIEIISKGKDVILADLLSEVKLPMEVATIQLLLDKKLSLLNRIVAKSVIVEALESMTGESPKLNGAEPQSEPPKVHAAEVVNPKPNMEGAMVSSGSVQNLDQIPPLNTVVKGSSEGSRYVVVARAEGVAIAARWMPGTMQLSLRVAGPNTMAFADGLVNRGFTNHKSGYLSLHCKCVPTMVIPSVFASAGTLVGVHGFEMVTDITKMLKESK